MAKDYIVSLTVILICCAQSHSICGDENVAVGLILVVSNSSQYNSVNSIEAVREGVKAINDRNDSGLSLTKYQLEISEMIVSQENDFLEQLFKAFLNSPVPTIGILDGGHPAFSEMLLSFSELLNIPIIAYSPFHHVHCGSVSLFSNMVDTLTALNGLVRLSKWNQVAIISEIQEMFLQIEEKFIIEASLDNITIDTRHISRLQSNLSHLYEGEHRVVILNTFEDIARKVLCEAYKRRIFHPHYTWIIYGWYSEDWLMRDIEKTPCTIEEMITVLDRAIVIQQTPTQEGKICLNPLLSTTERFNSIARDAVTTFALALKKSITSNEMLVQECGIKEITLNKSMDCKMSSELLDVVLQGYSGNISFDQNGYRSIMNTRLMQFRRENNCIKLKTIAVFHSSNLSITYIDGENNTTVFPDNIPHDESSITKVSVKSIAATVILYILATLGVLFTLFCLIFNVIFMKKKIIRLTSPNLNFFIVAGALIMYASIYIRMARTNDIGFWEVNCHTIIWTMFLGYCLCFCPYLAKIWRIYYIFHNPTSKKKKVTDMHLVVFVVVEIIIMLVLLIFGTGLPFTRPKLVLVDDPENPPKINERGVEVQYLSVNCFSPLSFLWIGAVILFYVLQHGFAIFFAIRIRKVKIKVLNEYKEVSATIYITTIAMAEGLAISIILQDFETIVESLVSTAIIIVATTYVGFTFIPKMQSLYRDPEGKKIFTQEDSMYAATEETTVSRNYVKADRDKIKALEDQIIQLKDCLQNQNGRVEKEAKHI